jgi:16S rRNA (guanine527-N7)-methyltransferase
MDERDVFSGILETYGIPAGGREIDMLSRFASLISLRSRRVNLMGPGEEARLWTRHFPESALYSLLLDRSRPVADIGSGAGFPGVVLAALGFEVVLLEPRRARFLFLEHAVASLEGMSARPVRARVEEAGLTGQFVARAVMPPGRLLRLLGDAAATGTLTMMEPAGARSGVEPAAGLELPCPPLDRPGLLSQYRIPF